MNYETAKARKIELENVLKQASAVLQKYPSGPNGLTPDRIKATAEWKADHNAYWIAHNALVKFNATFIRTFKSELMAERRAKYSY